MLGTGAALSIAVGGVSIQRAGYNASFLTLAATALIAFLLLWRSVPATLPRSLASILSGSKISDRVRTSAPPNSNPFPSSVAAT